MSQNEEKRPVIGLVVRQQPEDEFQQRISPVIHQALHCDIVPFLPERDEATKLKKLDLLVFPLSRDLYCCLLYEPIIHQALDLSVPLLIVLQDPDLEEMVSRRFPEVPLVSYYHKPSLRTPRQQLQKLLREMLLPGVPLPDAPETPAEAARRRLAEIMLRDPEGHLWPDALAQAEHLPAEEQTEELLWEQMLCCGLLAERHKKQNAHEEALEYLLKGEALALKLLRSGGVHPYSAGLQDFWIELADFYGRRGQTNLRNQYYRKILDHPKAKDRGYEALAAIRVLSGLEREAEDRGDLQQAKQLCVKAWDYFYVPLYTSPDEEFLELVTRHLELAYDLGDLRSAHTYVHELKMRACGAESGARLPLDFLPPLHGRDLLIRYTMLMGAESRTKHWLDKSFRRRMELAEKYPDSVTLWELGTGCLMWGHYHWMNNEQEATYWYDRALELYNRVGPDHQSPRDRKLLADACQGMARRALMEADREKYRDSARRCYELRKELAAESGSRQAKEALAEAIVEYQLAVPNSYELLQEAYGIYTELVNRYPQIERYRTNKELVRQLLAM